LKAKGKTSYFNSPYTCLTGFVSTHFSSINSYQIALSTVDITGRLSHLE